MKHLIIGGVAGGATAAARLRRIAENDEIILYEKGEHISYANCGLPYYIGGTISSRDRLFVQTPRSFSRRFNIDVRTNSEVTAIHPDSKSVDIKGPDGAVYTESYDRLLLSPGAKPFVPPLPGIELPGIFTLRNVADTDAVHSFLASRHVSRAIVIGGGFIGLEMAENLSDRGADVTLIEMSSQVMAPIDFSMAAIVHAHLVEKGVNLMLDTAVTSFSDNGGAIGVTLASGSTLEADIIILSIGVRPASELAVKAGLKTGPRGGIAVDSYLRTSAPDIYAVGDVIEYPHPIGGEPWLNYLAGPANRQARIAADNMALGDRLEYEGAIGTSIAKVFDLTVAAAGHSAKRLQQLGIPYLSATVHPSSHAGYYPEATPLTIKLLFAPESGLILGAQAVGYEGVDKRIDTIARLIKSHGAIADLIRTEHTYAPPYSSAKDPVAVAGYVADNIISRRMDPIYWRELRDAAPGSITLIDVRTNEEYATGSLPNAINIPLDSIRDSLEKIPAGRPIVVFCGVGLRGYLASCILRQHGYNDVRNLIGGLKTYRAATATLPAPTAKPSRDISPAPDTPPIAIDACGLSCPGPIMKLRETMDNATDGSYVCIRATDPGFPRDAEAWCQSTGHRFISKSSKAGIHTVTIAKATQSTQAQSGACTENRKTFIMFSDDLDKALATFVLANGAAATGAKVTIFFTFWGLNVIKKERCPHTKKDFFARMFSFMLPSSSRHLSLSKMNMAGIGPRMMRHIMKKRNVESLEALRDAAIAAGVEFIACQMSMDVMGVTKEELLDNVSIGGVATYMNRADSATLNLFI
ncbi:MAG: FAD-dependent oxidoreductase [Muribaculaceae bacterium]|nr:FAD-dependent oxidoreductase [Muribaculaceae bacterium]